jgi:hypothetical protein
MVMSFPQATLAPLVVTARGICGQALGMVTLFITLELKKPSKCVQSSILEHKTMFTPQ